MSSSPKFIPNVQDGLSSHIAILDEAGNIIMVNAAWKKFGENNGLHSKNHCIGENYLSICEKASGTEAEEAYQASQIIRDLQSGKIETATIEYSCHSNNEERWYIAYFSRFIEEEKAYVIVAHENITHRKRIENDLKVNEEKYRYLFANNPQPMLIYDLETLQIIEVNNAAITHYGYTKEEFLSMTLKDIRPPEDIPELLNHIKSVRNKYDSKGEWKHLKKNGEIIYVEIISHSITYNNRLARHVLITDITERKKAQEALLYEQYLMNSLMDNSPDYIYFKDLESKFIRINKALANRHGILNSIEAIGKTDFDLFADEHAKEAFNDEQEIVRTGIPIINKEEKEVWLNGNETWVSTTKMPLRNEVGEIIGTFGISRDITEQKLAEKQIRLLSRALEQSPVSIIIADRSGNIEYTNPKFTEVTGYSATEVKGKNPRFLKTSTHSREYYENLWNTILSGKDWHGEFLNKKKNGELLWESAIICPIVNDQGNIDYIISLKEDITHQKKMVSDLIEAKTKAEENDQLKTAFLHNISHEIRTPLNAIIGFSDILNDSRLIPEKRAQFTSIIKQNSIQLLSIITDVVNMAAIEAGQETVKEIDVNINGVLELVYSQFTEKAKSHQIQLEYYRQLPDSEALILTDENKLPQVLGNLVGNALKFTKEGHIKFGYNIEGAEVVFFVEDTGIGVPENMYEEIFKRFRQVDYSHTRKYGGSGLGLSISKAYVELMGGKIWVTSQIYRGSTFYFTIPYNKVLKHEQSYTKMDFKFKIPLNILIAEDEDFNFMLVEEMLSDKNITIVRAENGLEAVELCQSDQYQFDLILMDLKMPIMDGYEATGKIREFKPEIPIIALTAYTLDIDKDKAINSGCKDFLSKPFKEDQLMEKILEYFKER